MKSILLITLFFFSVVSYGQEAEPGFDGHKWEAPYLLPIPKDWTIERLLLPPFFAPSIVYKGVEDIRFMPGWGKADSDEYWTYAFLWYLDEEPIVNKDSLERHLRAYYAGLLKINTDSSKHRDEKPDTVNVKLNPAKALLKELAHFTGTIYMRDFLSRQPITLNCKIHVRRCSETKKTILFFELSPRIFENTVWRSLDQLWVEFKCLKD